MSQITDLSPILSEVTEKVVHKQTNKFLNDHKIFYKYQFCFGSSHSTYFYHLSVTKF